jgi:NitT/TauT family transport system ATP-binding protein
LAQAAKKLAPEAPDATKSPAVRLRDVTVRFTTERGAVTALDRVSMNVAQGGFLTLLGPSGCGKSTLLRVVSDLIPATSGEVEVMGGSAASAREARAIGFVFQDASLLAWRTALENVELPLGVGRGAKRGGASASPAGRRPIRTNCQAACASAWRSPARLSTIPSFC